MHTKTLETIKQHVAALPIQTWRSRRWSSNGSGVSLRSVGIGLGFLCCSRWSSSRWLEDVEEIRLNGWIRWTWRPWIEWFKGPMLELYQIRWRHIRFRRFLTLNWIYFLCVAVMRPLPTTRTAQGYVVKLFGGPIDWKSRKQITVTASTTEAELLAPSRRDYLTLLVLNLTAMFLSLAITNELSIP